MAQDNDDKGPEKKSFFGRLCALISEIAGMHEECTIVVVTHDIASAIKVSDCLWLLGNARDEAGAIIEGSSIRHVINLAERGIPWQKNIEDLPAYASTLREVENLFQDL